jgi:hypothetical protein
MPYLNNKNAFFDISLGFFIAILARFRQGYTVDLPIFFKLYKIEIKISYKKWKMKYVFRIFYTYIFY